MPHTCVMNDVRTWSPCRAAGWTTDIGQSDPLLAENEGTKLAGNDQRGSRSCGRRQANTIVPLPANLKTRLIIGSTPLRMNRHPRASAHAKS